MKISVVICTWNRARLLRATLQQLTLLQPDDRFDWELIIVNNNSSDATDDVIREYSGSLPIRHVNEPEPGLSRCRNLAVEMATGDYIVWTDDDVLASKRWILCYFDAFMSEPEIAFFGGPIEPYFEPPGCPSWLEATWEKCKGAFATRELGDQPIELNESRLPYGANFAIRADVQRTHTYDTQLGRIGSSMVGGEETRMLKSIVASGRKGRWVPGARLQHVMPPSRATEKYVRAYFVGQGVENIIHGKQERRPSLSLLDAMRSMMLYRITRLSNNPDQWVSYMIRASISWGEFRAKR